MEELHKAQHVVINRRKFMLDTLSKLGMSRLQDSFSAGLGSKPVVSDEALGAETPRSEAPVLEGA